MGGGSRGGLVHGTTSTAGTPGTAGATTVFVIIRCHESGVWDTGDWPVSAAAWPASGTVLVVVLVFVAVVFRFDLVFRLHSSY